MQNHSSRDNDRLLAWGLFVLVFLSPLPFGSVEPWAVGVLEVFIYLLFTVAMIRAWRAGGTIPLPLAGAALLFTALHAAQLAPLPAAILESVSPMSHTLQRLLRPEEALGRPMHVSIVPGATLSSLLWFLACCSAFLLPPVLCRRMPADRPFRVYLLDFPAGSRAGWAALALALTLTVSGTFQSAYGLLEHFLGLNRIFLYERRFPMNWVAGTFINSNHCAAFLGLCLPLMIALTIIVWRLTFDEVDGTRGTPPNRLLLPLLAGATALSALALLLTHSSGGLLASVSGLAVFFLAFRLHRGRGFSLNLVLALAAVPLVFLVAVVLLVSPEFTFSQYAEQLGWDLENRFSIYLQSLAVVRDFPLLGSGAGTYPAMMLHYFNRQVGHAHNEYLEVLCDLGPLGLLCLLLLLAFLARTALSCLRGGPQDEGPDTLDRFPTILLLPLAMACSLLSLALHAVVDFPLRIPAIALTAACLAGVFIGLCTERVRRR